MHRCADAEAAGGSDAEDDEDDDEDEDDEGEDAEAAAGGRVSAQSKHERRQARMRERIAALEEANMGDKDWFMRGEAKGGEGTRVHVQSLYKNK